MYRSRLFLALLLVRFEASLSFHVGSRSILRVLSKDADHDVAVDLNATSFHMILRDAPAPFAILEFYAHWCPACRNYKPQYEKVARLFNGPEAVHPKKIFMTRVDCAEKINNDLCEKYSVSHYPMLLWGQPSDFLSGGWDPKQNKTKICMVEGGRTADQLLNWINNQLGSSYALDDEKLETVDPRQIEEAIYDIEEATSTAFEIIFLHKMIKSDTRGSLIKFLQLLVAHHPSKRCRKGSAEILVSFDDLWPSDALLTDPRKSVADEGKDVVRKYHICGKEVPRGNWLFCHGSKNETRGFSCGLWVLLHSLSVRIDDGESQLAFAAVCDFIHNFFICEECRQHFYKMCSSVSIPFNKTRDFALWLWSTHNKVNERLMKEEESLGTGDPMFPKMIWPSKQICSSCYSSPGWKSNGSRRIEWDEDEVFNFLSGYYGKTLVSFYKDEELLKDNDTQIVLAEDMVVTANAVVVPLGAALAIAVASCAFGALACFWRTQQKNRKYSYHSLKII